MKVETIVTAIIFFSVGFLAGFVYKSQEPGGAPPQVVSSNSSAATASAGAARMGSQGGGSIDPATGLPAGHPPLKVAEAIKDYAQQARQNPRDPEIPLRLANYLYDQKAYNLAIEWYQKTLAINSKNVNAWTDLGTSYFYVGQPQEALKQYRKALKISPNHQPTLFNMIIVNLEGTHDYRAAERSWRELDRQNPNYPGLKELKQKLDAAMGTSSMVSAPQ